MKYIFCVAMLGSPTKAVPSAHVSFQQRHNTERPHLSGPSAEHHHFHTSSGQEDRPVGGCSLSPAPNNAAAEDISKSQKEITRTASAGVFPQVALTSSLPLAPSSPSCTPPETSASPGLVSRDSDPHAASSEFSGGGSSLVSDAPASCWVLFPLLTSVPSSSVSCCRLVSE